MPNMYPETSGHASRPDTWYRCTGARHHETRKQTPVSSIQQCQLQTSKTSAFMLLQITQQLAERMLDNWESHVFVCRIQRERSQNSLNRCCGSQCAAARETPSDDVPVSGTFCRACRGGAQCFNGFAWLTYPIWKMRDDND